MLGELIINNNHSSRSFEYSICPSMFGSQSVIRVISSQTKDSQGPFRSLGHLLANDSAASIPKCILAEAFSISLSAGFVIFMVSFAKESKNNIAFGVNSGSAIHSTVFL
ncbi:unnamed protein product [Meganyctiphanes norvegica]|uniref:Uncharacterized protein n=1 Tax=Meganyctiphanes norvegica TaxID=48144 RepID=A0AAV2PZ98_MEGNR